METDNRVINECGEVNGITIGRGIQNKHSKSRIMHVDTTNSSNLPIFTYFKRLGLVT
jgi:hypothetical protein